MIIIHKNNTNLITHKMAYIGLAPKSSHTIKYSQPLELVLFHVTTFRIYYLKGSLYSHLLNNYLIYYLIFSGSYRYATKEATTDLVRPR